jgi:hypothetical protein
MIVLLAAVTLLLAGCAGVEAPAEFFETFNHDDLRDKELTAENEYLALRFDCETTKISVTDKRSGKVWESNPAGVAEDSVAVRAIKEKLDSQLILYYGQTNGNVTEINSNTLSVMNGMYAWEPLENGVKVSYTIGQVETVYLIPEAVTETRFRSLYDQMGRDEQRALDNYYRAIDINNLRASENAEELLEKYPALAEERMFELREEMQVNLLRRLEDYFAAIGYTAEDYYADQAAVGEGEVTETPIFNISIIYELDGPDFKVTVPLEEIEYRYDYPVLSIAVLPYFGAGGTEDDGYMLVPDASGAIINFNNGKQNQQPYVNSVYGHDYALKRTAVVSDNAAPFPVFGINNNDGAFICVVEEGAENTMFEADVSGRVNSFNSANSRYTVRKWDDVDISKANVYAKAIDRQPLSGVFSQRYIFTEGTDYTSLALAYRDYLTAKYPSLTRSEESGLPTVLGLIGAIDRGTNIMGFPVIRPYALTTYEEAAGIISDYKNAGVDNLRVNYAGWFNGGVVHDTPANINLISGLGNKKSFSGLIAAAGDAGAELFMEADFTYINNLSLFNGYSVNRDSAKRLSRELVELYPYSFVWFGEMDIGSYSDRYEYYLATPDYTAKAIDSYYEDLTALGGKNVTFNSIGRAVNSDLNVKKPVQSREAAARHQIKLQELKDRGAELMVHNGFVYTVPYVDFIVDMELESKNFNIIDESIPFYQIALHGLVPYTGAPLNLAANYDKSVLKAVETGAGLQFLFMSAAGEELQDSNYTRYFGSDIARWGNRPAELYNRLNEQLGHTVNLFITGHQKLAEQVYLTEYEDGTRVVVNYSPEPFTYEGVTADGLDFAVLKP